MKPLPPRARLAAVALVVAGLLVAGSAVATYRDGPFHWQRWRRGPVLLQGATLGAGTAAEARERSSRLGFLWRDPPTDDPAGMPTIPLHEGRLQWTLEAAGPFATLDTRVFAPDLRASWAGGPLVGDPTIGHANHVTRLVGVIGIVSDVGAAVVGLEQQAPFDDRSGPIRFGRTYTIPTLDAWAADAGVPGGRFVRVIAPRSPASRCAGWRGGGSGRWIGLVFESDDLDATEAWFESHDVPFTRSGWSLVVDPEVTGGLYVEFAPKGAPRS